MRKEFEQALQSKEEEINIMSSLLNNTCETEPGQKISGGIPDQELIDKYEEIIKKLREEFHQEMSEINKEFKKNMNNLFKEKNLALKEVEFLKKEIYELKNTKESKSPYNPKENRLFNE
jgi:hypothetical protein